MQHLLLADDTLILIAPTTTITLTPNNFNYWRIRNLVLGGASFDQIEPLIVVLPPSTPVIYGYLYRDTLAFSVEGNLRLATSPTRTWVPQSPHTKFLGPFLDYEDLIDQFPEYLI